MIHARIIAVCAVVIVFLLLFVRPFFLLNGLDEEFIQVIAYMTLVWFSYSMLAIVWLWIKPDQDEKGN